MDRKRCGVVVIALALAVTPACKLEFLQQTIAAVEGAEFVTLSDLTANGYLDVIFTSWTRGELYVVENGSTGFAEPLQIAADLPQARNVIVARLFQPDGPSQILVSAFRGGHVAFELVDGVWARHVIDPVSYGAAGLAAADVGGSKALEVITATQGVGGLPGAVTVRRVLPNRTFTVMAELPVVDPTSVAAADVDGDGLRDILASDANGAIWWRNVGDFRFAQPVRLGRPVGPSSRLLVRDISGDGRPDFIIASHARGVWWVDGGCHQCMTRITRTPGVYHVELAPVLRGTRPDIIVVSGSPTNAVQVFRPGKGTTFEKFEIARDYVTGRSVVAGDLNLDGRLEFVTTSFGLGTVDVWTIK